MPVTVNFFGRVVGLLQGIWRKLYWVQKWAMRAGTPGYYFGGGLLGAAFFTAAWRAVDALLSAHVTLNSQWADAMAGNPGSASIGDILARANYYFPVDTLGHLSTVYVTLWIAVHAAKGAEKLVSLTGAVKGFFKL